MFWRLPVLGLDVWNVEVIAVGVKFITIAKVFATLPVENLITATFRPCRPRILLIFVSQMYCWTTAGPEEAPADEAATDAGEGWLQTLCDGRHATSLRAVVMTAPAAGA